MRKIIFIAFLFLFIISKGQTIHYNQWLLEKNNSNSRNLFEIKNNFNKSWAGKSYEKGKGWKQYKRWEYFTNKHTNKQGEILSLYDYSHEYETFLNTNGPTGDSTGNWVPLGPTQWQNLPGGYNPGIGRVNAVTMDPNNANKLLIAAASGGIWMSEDSGSSWTTTTDKITILGTSDVVVDPTNSNIIYMATGDRDGLDTDGIGVLKSIDGGLTWGTTGLSFNVVQQQYIINKLLHHPDSTGILIAATNDGIFKTNDAGQTWTKSSPFIVKDLEYQPNNFNIIFACNSNFYKSYNGGKTFVKITNGIPINIGRAVCSVTPADSNYVYLLVSDDLSNFEGVYRSTNAGESFTKMVDNSTINLLGYEENGSDNSSQAWYDLAIAVSPTNKNEIYTGGVNIWKSIDGGSNWQISSHWYYINEPEKYSHADIHSLDFYNGELYCGSDGGIFKKDSADKWTDLSAGLNIAQVTRMSNSQIDENYISSGHQDNGSNFYKNGVWNHVLGADGMETVLGKFGTDLIYVSSQNGYFSKSTDGGVNFTNAFNPDDYSDYGSWITPFEMSNKNNNTLFVACEDVYKSTNSGNSWTAISNDLNFGSLTCLKPSPSNDSIIYASYTQSFYYTYDGGTTWNANSLGIISGDISDIEVSLYNPKHVYITVSSFSAGKKIYFSNNGGISFSNISKNLPNLPANTLILDNEHPGAIYLGMDLGIYYTDSTLSEWIPFQNNLPNVIINELEIQYPSQKLRAATYGRGIWETPLFPTIIGSVYEKNMETISIFPNPASTYINIHLDKNTEFQLQIINIAGNLVFERTVNSKSTKIDVSTFSKGIYFVRLKNEQIDYTKKLIIFK